MRPLTAYDTFVWKKKRNGVKGVHAGGGLRGFGLLSLVSSGPLLHIDIQVNIDTILRLSQKLLSLSVIYIGSWSYSDWMVQNIYKDCQLSSVKFEPVGAVFLFSVSIPLLCDHIP